jgi:hypothetical protein
MDMVRSNKTISGLLILMVFMSGFITLCPDGHKGAPDIHFITDECDSHHCSRNVDPIQCETENCNHQLCIDQPLSDNFRPADSQQFNLTSATPVSINIDYPFTNNSSFCFDKFITSKTITTLRTTVLRI